MGLADDTFLLYRHAYCKSATGNVAIKTTAYHFRNKIIAIIREHPFCD